MINKVVKHFLDHYITKRTSARPAEAVQTGVTQQAMLQSTKACKQILKQNYMNINPYLNFAGNTEEAFNFYKSVFGGEFIMLQRLKDTPDADKLPAGVENMIMHVSLPIGSNNILMGTDAPEQMGFSLKFGNNSYICLGPDSRDEATRIFKSLSEGGKIEMDLADMFWGAYYGSLTDKFGVQWMINYQQ